MSEIQVVRLARLRQLLDARHLEQSERARYLSNQTSGGISYWSGLLAGSRPFGEKVARRLEEALLVAPGYLDDDVAPSTLSPEALALARAFDAVPESTMEQATKRDWLFSNLLLLIQGAHHAPAGANEPAPSQQPMHAHRNDVKTRQ